MNKCRGVSGSRDAVMAERMFQHFIGASHRQVIGVLILIELKLFSSSVFARAQEAITWTNRRRGSESKSNP